MLPVCVRPVWMVSATVALVAALAGGAAAAPPPAPIYITTIGAPACTPGANGCGLALTYPGGGDVDAAGNIYVSDTGNGQIEAFSPTGAELWRVGQTTGNAKTPGHFLNPRDLAYLNEPGYSGLNNAGLLFIADLANNRVDVLNAYDGSVNALSTGWTTRFSSVIGISAGFSPTGEPVIIATDSVSTPVREFSPEGNLVAAVGTKCTAAANKCAPSALLAPRDAATDAAGNVFVADYSNNRIVQFGPADLTTAVRAWGGRGTGNLQFNHPYGVAVDSAGHVYVADSDNARITEFDVSPPLSDPPTYLATYGSGTGPVGSGAFAALRRVAVTPGANPKVIGFDLWGNTIDTFTPPATFPGTGSVSSYLGGHGAAEGAFNSPYGVSVGAGNLFVADTNNQRIQAFTQSTNQFSTAFGQRGFGESNLGYNWPRDVAYAPSTNTVWVADTKNFRVSEFSLTGVATGRVFGKSGTLNWPYAIATSGQYVLVADTRDNRVQMWDPATNTVVWSTDTISTPISMNQPRAITVAANPASGNPSEELVYVADSLNKRILVLDLATGALVKTIAPTVNGAPVLHRVEGIAVDPRTGNIWVSDSSWNRIVELSADGQSLLVKFGSQGSLSNQFEYPAGLDMGVVNGVMTLYVADYWNNRIQLFDVDNL